MMNREQWGLLAWVGLAGHQTMGDVRYYGDWLYPFNRLQIVSED